MSPGIMTPPEMIAKVTILRGTAEGIRKAAREAEGKAKHKTVSEEGEREVRVASLLIESCRKLAERAVLICENIRASIRAGELREKDLLTTEQVLNRFFSSSTSSFTRVRSFIRHLQARGLNPHGTEVFQAAASHLAAARENFIESFSDLKDPKLQESIRKGFEEAMRASGEPWDWEKELFGDASK